MPFQDKRYLPKRNGTTFCVEADISNRKGLYSARIAGPSNGGAPFPAGREAVRMFLQGFPCVFFLAINVDRPEQYAELLRNLQAVYRRYCQEQGLARAFCANSALYAKPANALSSKVFSEVVDLASGDVVQLVRTLPCHGRGRGFESRRPRHFVPPVRNSAFGHFLLSPQESPQTYSFFTNQA
jgi:hypothetical protein